MDPVNAIAQSRAVGEALAELAPGHAEEFMSNFVELETDLQGLDTECRSLSPLVDGVRLLSSHPAYNYLSRRYGWGVTSFDLDPGETITPEQLTRIEAAKNPEADGLTVMLWESEPIEGVTVALDAIGISSVVFRPAETVDPERRAAGEDYLSIMHANIERLRAALTP